MTKLILALALPVLLVSAAPVPVQAASPFTLSVKNITIVPAPPTCEVRSTKKRMASGSATYIVWESKNATAMTGLTRGEQVWPTKGRQRVAIAILGKHEFPLTFEGPGGKTTCTAKVFVKQRSERAR
jgi:hypothetical protein